MHFAFKPLVSAALLCSCLHAQQQLLVVTAKDFNTSAGIMQPYEHNGVRYEKVGTPFPVNLGRNGLGWGIGNEVLAHRPDEPLKREGDGKAPAGIFVLAERFGYEPAPGAKMPYLHATQQLICIDDAEHPGYNTITLLDRGHPPKSFEWMHREDGLYEIGVTVSHNPQGIPLAGSCIFLHLEKGKGMPTSGCTSMSRADLEKVTRWLDADKKPLLVQIPQEYCRQITKRFAGVECEE